MKLVIVSLGLLAVVYCQTQNKNGNPTGEIGQPAFDEIVVESTLTVRGKSGSRSGKSLVTNPKPVEKTAAAAAAAEEETADKSKTETADGSSVTLKRSRRVPEARLRGGFGNRNVGLFPPGPIKNNFPTSSSSAAHASSNAFNSNTPLGSFGASASQSASQSQSFGPNGFRGSAGQSASQSYLLPNGNRIDLSYSNSFSTNNGKPSYANSQSLTITKPDGTVQHIIG